MCKLFRTCFCHVPCTYPCFDYYHGPGLVLSVGMLIAIDGNIGPTKETKEKEPEKPLSSAEALWLCSAESSSSDRDDVLSRY